jgi:hypothetical protein
MPSRLISCPRRMHWDGRVRRIGPVAPAGPCDGSTPAGRVTAVAVRHCISPPKPTRCLRRRGGHRCCASLHHRHRYCQSPRRWRRRCGSCRCPLRPWRAFNFGIGSFVLVVVRLTRVCWPMRLAGDGAADQPLRRVKRRGNCRRATKRASGRGGLDAGQSGQAGPSGRPIYRRSGICVLGENRRLEIEG